MDNLEPKKLALLRILQIFEKYSDCDHPLTQEDISGYLERNYGIVIERKAIGRNISLLKEAGIDIESSRAGSYLAEREFEDSELRMLIDGVLCSKYVPAKQSADLIRRLCGLSSQYFRAHIKNIHSVSERAKTENQSLFYTIEVIDEAIEQGKRLRFDFNKYGADKKLHRSASHGVSPYQLLLHNQRYYLIGLNERWKNMGVYRLDRISNIRIFDKPLTPLRTVPGYENGINYRELSTAFPYMYTDSPRQVELITDEKMIDQIIDWFGMDISIQLLEEKKVKVTLKASLSAMEYWAMQYINYVEVAAPAELREKIRENISNAIDKYQ